MYIYIYMCTYIYIYSNLVFCVLLFLCLLRALCLCIEPLFRAGEQFRARLYAVDARCLGAAQRRFETRTRGGGVVEQAWCGWEA